ncbi:PREDICTED: uncharacterized protein LOC101296631 [Fragaria vesca subsp. vesca]
MSSVFSEEVRRERFEVEKERLGSPASFRFRQSRGLSLVWIASFQSQEPFHVPGFRREARRRENRREEVLGFSGEGLTDYDFCVRLRGGPPCVLLCMAAAVLVVDGSGFGLCFG